MTIGDWFATRRVRHGATAGVVVLATGGLFLLHANAAPEPYTVRPVYPYPNPGDQSPMAPPPRFATPPPGMAVALPPMGPDTVQFAGPHVHGTFAVSNGRALAGTGQPLYADVTVNSDSAGDAEHAPLAMVIVLDTSGSMEGEKLREAKSAVKELVRNMRDEDDIAFVRYSDHAEVIEGLRRVGDVRQELGARVDRLTADGGTAIPLGLQAGIAELEQGLARMEHGGDRVRRVVLVSDGLDSSRPRSEQLAKASAWKGVTVSSMGIGLDFDEAYMGGVARAGHGNFGFVNDGPTLTAFLKRELVETATTVAQNTTVHLHLPDGVRFVKSTGADADVHGRDVDLRVGAIYADDAKRVLLQLTTDLPPGAVADFNGSLTWKGAGGGAAEATIPQLSVAATPDAAEFARSRNETVFGRVASVEASERQLEAAEAYAVGDSARANSLIQRNIAALKSASMAAPAPVASALAKQSMSYEETMRDFQAPPMSTSGKVAAKRAAASNMANSAKAAF
jgi:Ca-activated chloride channel family protein